MPSKPSSAVGHIPILPASFPPLVGPPGASRRHFCARGQQGRGEAKTQDRRKGHLQARHGVLYPCGYPYIPTPQNGPQKPPEARAAHKTTPARSVRSKPGHYHLFRAMDSTAQRSAVWSYQAQAYRMQFVPFPFGLTGIPLHALTCSEIANSGQPLYSSFPLIVSSIVVASKSRFIVVLLPESSWSSRRIVVTPPPQQTQRSAPQAAFGRESRRVAGLG